MGAHKSKYGHEHEHDENIPPDGQEQQEVAFVDEQEVRINEINARMEERRLWSRLPCDAEVFDKIQEYCIWQFFGMQDLRNASLVSRNIWTMVAKYMESTYYYKPSYWKATYYHPRKISTPTIRHIHYFSPFLTHLIIEGFFPIPSPSLPPTLTHLTITGYQYQPVSLPDSLRHFTICSFHTPWPSTGPDDPAVQDAGKLFLSTLPPLLTELSLGQGYCISISEGSLPSSLTYLSLTYTYKHSLAYLPKGLTHLKLSCDVEDALDYLTSLRSLTVSHQPITSLILPQTSTLTTLTISWGNFKSPIPSFPPSITNLTIPVHYNFPLVSLPPKLQYFNMISCTHLESLCNILPPTLTQLILPSLFNEPVDNLPLSLTDLTFGDNFNQEVDNLPPSLVTIFFKKHFNKFVNYLPPKTAKLTFGDNFDQPIQNLPPNLAELTLDKQFNQPLDHLPSSLQSLTIQRNILFNQPLVHLPSSLRILNISATPFNHSLNYLPSSLKILNITYSSYMIEANFTNHSSNFFPPQQHVQYSMPVSSLPPSLSHLMFTKTLFNSPLPPLPPTLTVLHLTQQYNHPLPPLPPTLQKLSLGIAFTHPLSPLPPALSELVIGNIKYYLPLPSLSLLTSPYSSSPRTTLSNRASNLSTSRFSG